jgi:hypothetical protein
MPTSNGFKLELENDDEGRCHQQIDESSRVFIGI